MYQRAEEFDLIHNHVGFLALPVARLSSVPNVTTLHGRLDIPDPPNLYRAIPEQFYVSISHAQREPMLDVNWVGNVYNGIDLSHFACHPDIGDYLVFLGRICPEQRLDRAIEIARDFGMRLIIAAKVDPVDQNYYDDAIAPLIKQHKDFVEYIGEVNEGQKKRVAGSRVCQSLPN